VLPTPTELRQQMQDAGLWNTPRNVVERAFHHGSVRVEYPEGPLLAPGTTGRVRIALTNTTERRMEGPLAAAALTPGLGQVAVVPAGLDLEPGQTATFEVTASLAADAAPRCHADLVVAVQAEGIAPWTFPVSFVRPMFWQMATMDEAVFVSLTESEPKVEGELVGVEGNRVPLPEKGMLLGRTRVFNPSAHERPVRLCSPSVHPVRVWFNGARVIDNPGAERIRPSYHSNTPAHYGAGVLKPGWNTITAAWLRMVKPGESHFFLTDPGGKGWGDLVFQP